MQCADLEIVSCSDQMSCSDHVIEYCNLIGAYRVLVFCYLITGTQCSTNVDKPMRRARQDCAHLYAVT